MELLPRRLSPQDTPPIRSTHELALHWRRLMGPLGFGHRHFWITVTDRDGRLLPVLPKIEELPDLPDDRTVGDLMCAMAEGLGHPAHGITLAFLLARPGGGRPTRADRRWATVIRAEARRHGVPLWPTFLATATGITRIDPDEVEVHAA